MFYQSMSTKGTVKFKYNEDDLNKEMKKADLI